MPNSSLLAVKTLNQYRKRDVLSYLGLRYYLKNVSAKKCRWIRDVSTRLSSCQGEASYLKTFHFKELSESGAITHREIYLPAPNEALSETALLVELSKHSIFHPKPYVYSYRFTEESDKSGVFNPYFIGYKERQADIANACWSVENGMVLITDIKKFYPSIHTDLAIQVWQKFCQKSDLESKFELLGHNLLNRQQHSNASLKCEPSLLTGPAFSHVIANLLLDSLDEKMHNITEGKYFRYVDDIAFVGNPHECKKWREILVEELSEFNLELHIGDKDFEVTCEEWLEGENDFESSLGLSWVAFIADVKRYLIAKPHRQKLLSKEFLKQNIRLPILDYSNVVNESNNLERFQDWLNKYNWSFRAVNKIDVDHLLKQAKLCETALLEQFNTLLEQSDDLTIYQRKRLIPKLRYVSGRVLIFADDNLLLELAKKLQKFPELQLITATMKAISTKDVTEIIAMGVNATQAVSQILRAKDEEVTFNIDKIRALDNKLIEQCLAILTLNEIRFPNYDVDSEIITLAKGPVNIDIMNSSDLFIKEVASLHGVGDSLNSYLMNTAFDRDEDFALDIINQLQQSSHA
ncbi:RNA-directed DNA polymerase [Psychrosphaera ytuae]|uniref:RNA-directed DNA polymerase n=1 Tax=Psychrosphaera ytuae TaxID=2820710 RepID=A0A975DA38_9GAMM|nr:RNA-directed DNA polymerase [Psychrosphaera ytuae]QTH63337.1 RNA-directed DNA polymerase [Psychrosphaera ytuae]